MVHQVIYAFRGWVAFVAFLDFGAAMQCFIDAESFLGLHLHVLDSSGENVTPAMARLLGSHKILEGFIFTHCALCIHHIPLVCLSIVSCLMTILMNILEVCWYQTAPVNFYTIFPIVISFITMIGLGIAPKFLRTPLDEVAEETHMLKISMPRRKRWNRKRE